jgi:large subunit ribosomal protein L25
MSVANFEFVAQKRDDLGKSASRRLRHENKVLGVVYGGGEAATSIALEQRLVAKALENEAVYSHILTLSIAGKKQQVVLRDVQRHPFKPIIQHLDFMRVKESDMITMHVPLHFIGDETCPGVENGGIVNHLLSDIEIRCQAGKLPEFIEVDVSALELDQDISLSQIKVPAGVEVVQLTQGHDLPVVSVHLPRQSKADEEQAAEEAAAAAAESAAEAAAATDSAEQGKAEDNAEGKDKDKH